MVGVKSYRHRGTFCGAGLISLTEMSQRLSEDHRNAQILAKGLAEMPLIDLELNGIHSNIIVFKLR